MKKRLDVLLYDRGFVESREKAKALIMSGIVYVDNQKHDKAGENIDEDSIVEVRGKGLKYVSRGGLKLEKALETFPINLTDKICMDIGASTGGFTDCMLQNGAKKVYSVDVGYGQLAWKLRSDERVVNLERTNARYLTEEQVLEKIDFVSVDVSFISLELILGGIRPLLGTKAELICLIKPQFEAGKDKVGKKGVVREKETHIEVIDKIIFYVLKNGFAVKGLTFSPIKGPEGNIEYLIYLEVSNNPKIKENLLSSVDIVTQSHNKLN